MSLCVGLCFCFGVFVIVCVYEPPRVLMSVYRFVCVFVLFGMGLCGFVWARVGLCVRVCSCVLACVCACVCV